jgi:hypothetical protein
MNELSLRVLRYNERNEVVGYPQIIQHVSGLYNFMLSLIKKNRELMADLFAYYRNVPFVYPRVYSQSQAELVDAMRENSRQVFKTVLEGYFKIDKEVFQKVSKTILDDTFTQYQNNATLMLALFGSFMLVVVVLIWIFMYKWTVGYYSLISAYLDVKPAEVRLQMDIIQNEQEIFGKYNMSFPILTSVLFNLNSEDYKNKIDDRMRQTQEGDDELRKRKARASSRSSKSQKKDYRFDGIHYLRAMTIVALLMFTVFLVCEYFLIRTSQKKIEVEKEFTRSQIQLTDFTHFIFSSMSLVSDGNFYKYSGQYPEEINLRNSVDNLVSFWNSMLPSFDRIFGENAIQVKEIIYGNLCNFISVAPESERQRQMGLCRAGANGAAANGGLLGFAYYTKDLLGSIKDRLLRENQDFLRRSKTEEVPCLVDDYFSENFIRVRAVFRQILVIMSEDLNLIFLARERAYEEQEKFIMTLNLTFVGILSLISIIFALASVKKMNRERHIGYETMRNICPFHRRRKRAHPE